MKKPIIVAGVLLAFWASTAMSFEVKIFVKNATDETICVNAYVELVHRAAKGHPWKRRPIGASMRTSFRFIVGEVGASYGNVVGYKRGTHESCGAAEKSNPTLAWCFQYIAKETYKWRGKDKGVAFHKDKKGKIYCAW